VVYTSVPRSGILILRPTHYCEGSFERIELQPPIEVS